METHPVVVIIIRALRSHLPRYHDDGDAMAPADVRRRHVVAKHSTRTDTMSRQSVKPVSVVRLINP